MAGEPGIAVVQQEDGRGVPRWGGRGHHDGDTSRGVGFIPTLTFSYRNKSHSYSHYIYVGKLCDLVLVL